MAMDKIIRLVVTLTSAMLAMAASPSSATTTKLVRLKSSEDEVFEVEEAVVMKSAIIKNIIEDTAADETTVNDIVDIPLFQFPSKILPKGLLDLASGRLGETMKGKSPREIRKMFDIKEVDAQEEILW
ncbi:SCF ubiquitin ligase complex subunit Skp1 [Ancistrocladus abbreviatus]